MSFDTRAMIGAIDEHSHGLAAVAAGHLDVPIEHCPGWSMADLLRHLVEVHRFWSVIAEEGLTEPPQLEPVAPEAGESLIEQFLQGARRLTSVLASADQRRAVWTWAPGQRDVAFITRHQVQEIAVHHWDGAHAVGVDIEFDPALASDAVDEFLTFSMSSDFYPADPPQPPIGGALALVCTDAERSWTLSDGATPGTVASRDGFDEGAAQLRATSSQLLLWLYSRTEIEADDRSLSLARRLRALTFTD